MLSRFSPTWMGPRTPLSTMRMTRPSVPATRRELLPGWQRVCAGADLQELLDPVGVRLLEHGTGKGAKRRLAPGVLLAEALVGRQQTERVQLPPGQAAHCRVAQDLVVRSLCQQ